MPQTLPMSLKWGESFDVGPDTLTIRVDTPKSSPAGIEKIQAAQTNKSSE